MAELFNLADDPSGSEDVHADHPEIVRRLHAPLVKIRDDDRSRP